MANTVKLERFWLDLISAFSFTERLDGAAVVCYPKVPFFVINHAADVRVNEDEAPNLLKQVEDYFRSRGVAFVCFRVSPLTKPESFAYLLERQGFVSTGEQSVMVFKGSKISENENANVLIKQITSDAQVQVYNKLLLQIFEMPQDWEAGFAEFNRESKRAGWRLYLGYVEGKPVGTCALFSAGKVGGIFNVGPLASCRKQGIGTALTLHALTDSIAEGNMVHTLQAGQGGNAEQLYKKLGFSVDHTIRFFVKDLAVH